MRTIRDAKLETRAARARLTPGKRPHWKTLVPGQLHLGYRRKVKDEPGQWLARRYIGHERYRVAPLGLADDFSDDLMTFAAAQRAAHAKMAVLRSGATLTVADAMADYVAWLEAHKATGKDTEARAAKLILPELGKLRLTDLTTARLTHWRDALAQAPALVRTKKGAEQRYRKPPTSAEARRARRASTNRTLTILKAALNRAFAAGHVEDDTAWRRVKPFEAVTAARPGFLTVAEAQRLINAATPDFRAVVHGALLTGCRWGELRAMLVRDYGHGKIHVARSKTGRPRDVVLTEEGVKFFDAHTVGRAAEAPLFVRGDGGPWRPSQQLRPMREACARAKIKPAVGIHQLRHTWASLAVMNNTPLMVVARNLGHVSTVMVERHYGHLTDSYIDEAVKRGAPRYGVATGSGKIVPLRK